MYYLFIFLSMYLLTHLPTQSSIYPPIHLSIHLPTYPQHPLSSHPSFYLPSMHPHIIYPLSDLRSIQHSFIQSFSHLPLPIYWSSSCQPSYDSPTRPFIHVAVKTLFLKSWNQSFCGIPHSSVPLWGKQFQVDL